VILSAAAHAADLNGALGRGRRAAQRDEAVSGGVPASD
jgi:hypothetical protein